MPLSAFIARLAVAVVLGSLIGIERQWHQRTAGLRTNALVSIGAALFSLAALAMANPQEAGSRTLSQIVTGIGFLCAGVIMRDGVHVRGLNTAATVWCAAAVGVLAGFGLFPQAACAAVAIVGTNVLLRPLAQRLNQTLRFGAEQVQHFQISVVGSESAEMTLRQQMLEFLAVKGITLRGLQSKATGQGDRVEICAEFVSQGRIDTWLEGVVSRIGKEASVRAVSWRLLPEDGTTS